jgi:hypothetical protein
LQTFSYGALRARASLFMSAYFDPRDEVAEKKFLDPNLFTKRFGGFKGSALGSGVSLL